MIFLQFGLGGAGVQIVETHVFWEVLWWKHLHMKNMQKKTWKNQKKTKKTKSSDPWARSGERPGRGHGSELFVFFLFFHGFLQFGQNLEKTKKTQKKSSDPWARSGERHGRGHGSELFVFLVFPWFFAIWPKPRENQKSTKKKVQTHGQGLGSGLAGDMGLNFLFFLFFHWFLACFSCEDAFITLPLTKCAFLQFAHLRPPWVPLLFFFFGGGGIQIVARLNSGQCLITSRTSQWQPNHWLKEMFSSLLITKMYSTTL